MAKKKKLKTLSTDLYNIRAGVTNRQALANAATYIQAAAKGKAVGRYSSGELANSIGITMEDGKDGATAHIGTNKEYALYVELGTGPKGQADHTGISPDVTPTYRQSPWWIHESQIDKNAAAAYHWFYVDVKDKGRFYRVTGQPARPYLYPAIHDHQKTISRILGGDLETIVRKATK